MHTAFIDFKNNGWMEATATKGCIKENNINRSGVLTTYGGKESSHKRLFRLALK